MIIIILYMISEGSCDSEDWRNDAENSALPTQLVLQYLWTPASMQNLSLVLLRL